MEVRKRCMFMFFLRHRWLGIGWLLSCGVSAGILWRGVVYAIGAGLFAVTSVLRFVYL